jgi:flagellar L-ring protein precursor FlgH
MKALKIIYLIGVVAFCSCASSQKDFHDNPTIPALEYSNRLNTDLDISDANNAHARASYFYKGRVRPITNDTVGSRYTQPQLRYVKDWPNQDDEKFAFRDQDGKEIKSKSALKSELSDDDTVTNMKSDAEAGKEFSDLQANQGENNNAGTEDSELYYQQPSSYRRDYNGPLSLGDPGLSASLWKESRRGTNLIVDDRAWQAMDLITIDIMENSQGIKQADTEVKQSSSILSGISKLLGFQKDIVNSNTKKIPATDLPSLINAESQNNYKGEGDTTRSSSLRASISAMVVEVLPSGVLRIEGEKIISVNQEEQIMVISGLVRTRDIDSNNNVQSTKIAQMRIDYYGKGIVGDAQREGWLSSILRKVWPF